MGNPESGHQNVELSFLFFSLSDPFDSPTFFWVSVLSAAKKELILWSSNEAVGALEKLFFDCVRVRRQKPSFKARSGDRVGDSKTLIKKLHTRPFFLSKS